jgi:hypothetical protein
MSDNAKQTGAALEAHYLFLLWLLPTVEKFPRSHKFTFGDRIENIALDVLEALIEATYTRDRADVLRRGNLGIEKLRAPFRRRHYSCREQLTDKNEPRPGYARSRLKVTQGRS